MKEVKGAWKNAPVATQTSRDPIVGECEMHQEGHKAQKKELSNVCASSLASQR